MGSARLRLNVWVAATGFVPRGMYPRPSQWENSRQRICRCTLRVPLAPSKPSRYRWQSAVVTLAGGQRTETQSSRSARESIRVSKDRTRFVLSNTQREFRPWGFNYDHDASNRLLEDYWKNEWATVSGDFEEMFPLNCSTTELGAFIEGSRRLAVGWLGFYWGKTIAEYKQSEPDIAASMALEWLESFAAKTPDILGVPPRVEP